MSWFLFYFTFLMLFSFSFLVFLSSSFTSSFFSSLSLSLYHLPFPCLLRIITFFTCLVYYIRARPHTPVSVYLHRCIHTKKTHMYKCTHSHVHESYTYIFGRVCKIHICINVHTHRSISMHTSIHGVYISTYTHIHAYILEHSKDM